ncbi:BREX-3 system phosphatase PglZ [Acidobacteriota bacterium]
MISWRDQILKEFTPKVARLTLVADPDGLLLEERILAGVREREFELIQFEDHITFRYAYESKFRSCWDKGKQTDLVVVLRSGTNNLGSLPYDLLQAGRRLSFNLGEIFPNLSYPIVVTLDREDFDVLYEAQKQYAPGILGDNATKEFILRHVFEIAPELIKKPSDLLRVLIRHHFRNHQIPIILSERFIQMLHQQDGFNDWPLDKIIPNRGAFFGFLQERWPIFLNRVTKLQGTEVSENQELYNFEFSGPPDLPFEHDDIRIYVDNLFLEGILQAVPHKHAEALLNTWLSIGILMNERAERIRRIDGLLKTIASAIPKENSRHENWVYLAKTLAELISLALEADVVLPDRTREKIRALQNQIDTEFVPWLIQHFAELANLPPVPPVMLHHIPRFLARRIDDDNKQKIAFLLVDGLSLDQWIVIRKELVKKRPRFRFRENAVFAWIPTITSVSRQTSFAGKPPFYFPNSINTTDKEATLWTQFWVDQGLTQQEVAYAKGMGDGSLDRVEEVVTRPKTRVVGLVVDKVDKIMHGMELGTAGMHNQVRQWAAQPFMIDLIDLLLDNGFHIFITSDHGNIEASGCGRPSEGSVADLRGERVRIYSDSLLRGQIKKQFPEALEWPSIGLPEDFLPLIAPSRQAFVNEKIHAVCHGGVSVEEVIVPLIEIERKNE